MLNSTADAVRLQAEPSIGALLLLLSNSQTSISLGGETSHFPTGPLLHHQQVSELGQYQGTGHFRQNKVFPENVLLEMSIQCSCNSSMTRTVLPRPLARLQGVESCTRQVSFTLSLQPATSLWTTTSHFLECIFLQNGFQSTYISLLSTVSGERHRK